MKRAAPKHAREKKLRQDTFRRKPAPVTLAGSARLDQDPPQHDEHVRRRAGAVASADRIKASLNGPQEPFRARKERERQEKAHEERRARLASAAVSYAPGTRSAKREHEIQSLGATKRARSIAHAKLFRSAGEATAPRVLACSMYDDLWHFANAGQLPPPSFMPKVDCSASGDGPERVAGGQEKLSALVAALGREQAALLYFRIIENWTFTALAESFDEDERKLSARFVAAADAAARFFGLQAPSRMVRAMEAMSG